VSHFAWSTLYSLRREGNTLASVNKGVVDSVESGKTIATLRRALDRLATTEVEASVKLERRQLEMLMMHALEISGGDLSFVMSPSGKGAYAEQFVKLDAAAVQQFGHGFVASEDPLTSRRADAITQNVMRFRVTVQGSIKELGCPIHLSGNHPPIKHFIMLPIDNGSVRTSALFVSNPDVTVYGKVAKTTLSRLKKLADAISKRQKKHSKKSSLMDSLPLVEQDSRFVSRMKSQCGYALITVDVSGALVELNPAARMILGCSRKDIDGIMLDRYLSPKYYLPVLRRVKNQTNSGDSVSVIPCTNEVVSILDERAISRQVSFRVYAVSSDKRQPLVTFVIKVVNDDMAARQVGDVFSKLTETSTMAVMELDSSGACVFVNTKWQEMTDFDRAKSSGMGWAHLLDEEDLLNILSALGNVSEGVELYNATVKLRSENALERWIALSLSAILDSNGDVSGYICVGQDVSKAVGTMHKIRRVVERDLITGLFHRAKFMDKLQSRLSRRSSRSKTALVYLDVGGLRNINTVFGQDTGDEVLRLLSERLMSNIDANSVCGRISGSKFAVIINEDANPVVLKSIADNLLGSLNATYQVYGHTLSLSISLGIAIADETSDDSDQILQNARQALMHAKSSKSLSWALHTKKLQINSERESLLNFRIRRAVELEEFSLDYQPQYRLDSYTVASFEALLRWNPTEFASPSTPRLIQLLESMSLMEKVGWWVLETACQQFNVWNDIGLLADNCTMSVNLSPELIKDRRFPDKLSMMLSRYKMLPGQLNLEVTEASLNHFDKDQIQMFKKLDLMGVQLSLDDFGAGVGSLACLNLFPVDSLKLDQSIINSIDIEGPSRNMVISVLAIARSMEIEVVADGIDNKKTLSELREANCNLIQGDVVAKPAPAANLEPLLIRQYYKNEDVLLLA